MAGQENADKLSQFNGSFSDIDNSDIRKRKISLNFAIIGAGSRGNAYASALRQCTSVIPIRITGVAEPIASKREAFYKRHILDHEPLEHYEGWKQFVEATKLSHERGHQHTDGVFVCTLDGMHEEIITALAPYGLHVMSEKPLATTLDACLRIYRALQPPGVETTQALFSIGHVLRYSPHNLLLRKLLIEDRVIGDLLSIEHTEPVGWWHFSHAYVRGNWRKESMTAPSLLTKSCHDIDLLLWLLCWRSGSSSEQPHLPYQVTSTGSLLYYKKARKPALAETATNCLSCPAEHECLYSAKKIYLEGQLNRGNAGWPITAIDPDIEDLMNSQQGNNYGSARKRLLECLSEDYDTDTAEEEINCRLWFGRCVYESSNDVCDDQTVTMMWNDDPLPAEEGKVVKDSLGSRGAKVALFHMVASTEKQCERRGRVYGTTGEIEYDSKTIRVYDFATERAQTHHAPQPGGGHGGGDAGLVQHFVNAIQAVSLQNVNVAEAQRTHIGCTVEEAVMSHAMVFAAEEARREHKVVDWGHWYQNNVVDRLHNLSSRRQTDGHQII